MLWVRLPTMNSSDCTPQALGAGLPTLRPDGPTVPRATVGRLKRSSSLGHFAAASSHRRPREAYEVADARQTISRIIARGGLLGFALLMGCQGYRLQGVVVEGPVASVMVVGKKDVRLGKSGVEEAAVELTLDPFTLKPLPAGSAVTDENGRFSIEVHEIGAGFLEYEAGVLCEVAGYGTVYQTFELPNLEQRVIITVAPGESGRMPPRNELDETLEIGRRLSQ